MIKAKCVKAVYQSEQTAKLFCIHARKDGKPRKGPMKEPYMCPECSTPEVKVWHLKVWKPKDAQ